MSLKYQVKKIIINKLIKFDKFGSLHLFYTNSKSLRVSNKFEISFYKIIDNYFLTNLFKIKQ